MLQLVEGGRFFPDFILVIHRTNAYSKMLVIAAVYNIGQYCIELGQTNLLNLV